MTTSLSIIESPEFLALWNEFSRRFIPWQEFKYKAMPLDKEPIEIWRIITVLRREMATIFNYPPWFPYIEDGMIWFTTPKESQELLREISSRTNKTSSLSRTMAKMDGYHFCQYLMLDEFIAALAMDGVKIDKQAARAVALHGSHASNSVEQLFMNLCNAFAYAAMRYKNRDISFGLIEDIERDVSENIDPTMGHSQIFPLADAEFFTPDYTLGLIVGVANGHGASDSLHPIVTGGEMSRMFWDLQPLRRFNSCVELVLRKVFFINSGYPVCAFTHQAASEFAWRQNKDEEGGFLMHVDGYPPEYQFNGIDGTLYHDRMLRQYDQEINRLEHRVQFFTSQRKRQRTNINKLAGLNTREKDILLNLLRNPLALVTIDRHRTRHEIAYSTAHDDLAHLEDLGYLKANKSGRALVYSCTAKLTEFA